MLGIRGWLDLIGRGYCFNTFIAATCMFCLPFVSVVSAIPPRWRLGGYKASGVIVLFLLLVFFGFYGSSFLGYLDR